MQPCLTGNKGRHACDRCDDSMKTVVRGLVTGNPRSAVFDGLKDFGKDGTSLGADRVINPALEECGSDTLCHAATDNEGQGLHAGLMAFPALGDVMVYTPQRAGFCGFTHRTSIDNHEICMIRVTCKAPIALGEKQFPRLADSALFIGSRGFNKPRISM